MKQREHACETSQGGKRSSQNISKIQKCLQPHTFLMTQIRNVLRKWHQGSTVCLRTSPEDRNCEVCLRTKMTRAPCGKRTGEALRAEKFGDLITADHKVLSEGGESRNNHRYAVVVQDLATQWIQSYPCKTKTSHKTGRSLRKILEPSEKAKAILTENSLECGKSCEDLSWNHRTSSLHRSETNGIPARAVRRIKEGTSAVAIRLGWKMVGWFYGQLVPSAKCSRPPGRRENTLWKAIRRPI